MLSVSQAMARVLEAVATPRPCASELIAIEHALDRFLATDIIAGRALPPHDNSAMDGFAVRARDLPGTLPVRGTIAAGDAPGRQLPPRSAWRIMTGAPMPRGADTVVIREQADDRGDTVHIEGSARPGENVRRAGEDVALEDRVLDAGTRVGPGEIGLLAALGQATVTVYRRPRVAILSTGDELVGVDVTPGPGQIVNSNAYALAAQVREAGAIPVPMGIAPDRLEPTIELLRRGTSADVLVTSGGVSVGDYDHVKDAFSQAGVTVDFWKVAMKPGKPLVFGRTASGTPVFGLPGNPVSSMVAFELFVRPALLAMQGAIITERRRAPVALRDGYRKTPGRAHYVRARLERDGDVLVATPVPKQGSGMLSSMIGIDALLEIPAERGDVPAGARVSAILLGTV